MGKLHEPDSFLGLDPKCDICQKPVEAGDKVSQTITGIVTLTETDENIHTEMGILEQAYNLVHVDCMQKVKLN